MAATNSTRAQLPEGFAGQIEPLLPDDFEAFLASFDHPRSRGLRLNPAKTTWDELAPLLGFERTPLAWCADGSVVVDGVSLGRHPAHLAGLFYLQEPSSMAVAAALRPEPGWVVADLAAAPGGKTTHLASLVGPSGLVVANEVVGSRLRPLHDNLDRWGATNVVTTSLPVESMVAPTGGFDGVVLDAPCTGEALFRRDPTAIRHWSPAAVEGAARRQAALLAQAARLVHPGGVLVYSTCSFNRAENEDRIAELVTGSDQWEIEDCTWLGGSHGQSPSTSTGTGTTAAPATERTARFWPHRGPGEGQFVARLRRLGAAPPGSHDLQWPSARHRRSVDRRPVGRSSGEPSSGERSRRGSNVEATRHRPLLDPTAAWHEFRVAFVPGFGGADTQLEVRGDWIFATPPTAAGLAWPELRRPGLPLGRIRPGRFEPHPALANTLDPNQVRSVVSWPGDHPDLSAYLRGETVSDPGPDGGVLICYHRWGLGWARRSRGILKNALPPHLRRQASGLAPRRQR